MPFVRFLLIVAGILAAALPAHAEGGRRIALVVGNSVYERVASLPNPSRDAHLMTETLRAVGFEVTEILDADQRTLKQAMLSFGQALRSDIEASLFYYAGHGMQSSRGNNYLLPVDAAVTSEAELDLQAVRLDDFLALLEESNSGVNIVILDACRNNPFATSRSASRGLAMVNAPGGTYIAYATAPGEVAEDGDLGNSPYTWAVTTAIAKPGQTIEQTFKEARRLVVDATKGRQVPWESSSIMGEFFFLPAVAAPPVETVRPVDPAAPPQIAALGPFVAPPFDPASVLCDRAVADPDDPDRPLSIVGIPLRLVKAEEAVPACRDAALEAPGDRRMVYQLGRALQAQRSYEEARQWYERAVALNSSSAARALGHLYDADGGLTDDFGTARAWYDKAVELGEVRALTDIGVMYELGRGVPQDFVQARTLYERALQGGCIEAGVNLGLLYQKGLGGLDRNFDRARGLYEEAAAKGSTLAMIALGYLYQRGIGVNRDLVEARRWYEEARKLGNENATRYLDVLAAIPQ